MYGTEPTFIRDALTARVLLVTLKKPLCGEKLTSIDTAYPLTFAEFEQKQLLLLSSVGRKYYREC